MDRHLIVSGCEAVPGIVGNRRSRLVEVERVPIISLREVGIPHVSVSEAIGQLPFAVGRGPMALMNPSPFAIEFDRSAPAPQLPPVV